MTDERQNRPILSADVIGRQKIDGLLYVTRPILSANISATNLAVELVLISPIKSGDRICQIYHSSVIDLRHHNWSVADAQRGQEGHAPRISWHYKTATK